MTLGELIKFLKTRDSDEIMSPGVHCPHSYRGYYSELALEPTTSISVGQLLSELESVLNTELTGYKGGEYKMHEYVDVYIAGYGRCGFQINNTILAVMLRDDAKVALQKEMGEVL